MRRPSPVKDGRLPDRNRQIVRVALPVPLYREFDYELDSGTVAPGVRVEVPFAGRTLVGIVTDPAPPDPHHSPKPVRRIIDERPVFDADLLHLARWVAAYYHHPLGEVFATMLPAQLRSGLTPEPQRQDCWLAAGDGEGALARAPRQRDAWLHITELGIVDDTTLRRAGFSKRVLDGLRAKGLLVAAERPRPAPEAGLTLTDEQRAVVDQMTAGKGYRTVLLDGITGSGKTEVYLQVIEAVLAAGRGALVLVPEIALTPQTVARFRRRFALVEAQHSNLTARQRADVWTRCRRGEVAVLIGTRSAVFTPFPDLGLIVVDEEHDGSYKQGDGLRYSARDVAVKRARDLDIPLILGSATPSLESIANARAGRYRHARLTRRPGGARLPDFHVVDLRGLKLDGGLSRPLLERMAGHLDAGNQVLVFLNRRGYAPTYLCSRCGWSAACDRCSARMTLHRVPAELRCHHCNRRIRPPPQRCPGCDGTTLVPVGAGTQRAAEVLIDHFPGVPLVRIDRDTTRSQVQLEATLAAAHDGGRTILLGTQMLAKGHHFPAVTLVAVVNADGGFFSPDFRAPEHTAQLIVQVAGRAGRAERPGEVWVQTFQVDNPLLQSLIVDGYEGFAEAELAARTAAGLPPAGAMALFRAEAVSARRGMAWLAEVGDRLAGWSAGVSGAGVSVLGPAPAPIARVADRDRSQLMVLSPVRTSLHRALRAVVPTLDRPHGVRWSLDVDPFDTL